MPIRPDSIKPKSIDKYPFVRRLVRGVGTGALLPVIGLECFVTGGRTVQSYKRGGFDEGRERFTEEIIGAFFWFCGVKLFNRMNDAIGKRILKLKDSNFDVGKDAVRNPLVNYLDKYGNKIINEKTISIFKFTKVAASIVLANVLVGFVVPKINQKITVDLHNKREIKKTALSAQTQTPVQDNKIIDYEHALKLQNSDEPKKNKENGVNFGFNPQNLLTLANHFEHDNIYQLLSTDAGITAGRTINSRNNHERIEVLFRDLSSIYFYMFAMGHVDSILNLIEDGTTSRLDPVASQQVVDQLKLAFEADVKSGKISPDELKKLAFGEEDKLKYLTKEIEKKFGKDGVMNLEDFISELKLNKSIPANELKELERHARAMSTLQPKINGVSKITKDQAEKALRGGVLNMAEFLDNLYGLAANNDMFGKSTDYVHHNPFKYVSHKSLTGKENEMGLYIEQLIKKAKKQGKDITLDFIEKFDKANLRKAGFNKFVGFGISALFLSTLIPKIQFWITKKTTGKNSFPGMTDYSDEKNQKRAV